MEAVAGAGGSPAQGPTTDVPRPSAATLKMLSRPMRTVISDSSLLRKDRRPGEERELPDNVIEVISRIDLRVRAVLAFAAVMGYGEVLTGEAALEYHHPHPANDEDAKAFAIVVGPESVPIWGDIVVRTWEWWRGPGGAAMRKAINDDSIGAQPRQSQIFSFFKAMSRAGFRRRQIASSKYSTTNDAVVFLSPVTRLVGRERPADAPKSETTYHSTQRHTPRSHVHAGLGGGRRSAARAAAIAARRGRFDDEDDDELYDGRHHDAKRSRTDKGAKKKGTKKRKGPYANSGPAAKAMYSVRGFPGDYRAYGQDRFDSLYAAAAASGGRPAMTPQGYQFQVHGAGPARVPAPNMMIGGSGRPTGVATPGDFGAEESRSMEDALALLAAAASSSSGEPSVGSASTNGDTATAPTDVSESEATAPDASPAVSVEPFEVKPRSAPAPGTSASAGAASAPMFTATSQGMMPPMAVMPSNSGGIPQFVGSNAQGAPQYFVMFPGGVMMPSFLQAGAGLPVGAAGSAPMHMPGQMMAMPMSTIPMAMQQGMQQGMIPAGMRPVAVSAPMMPVSGHPGGVAAPQ